MGSRLRLPVPLVAVVTLLLAGAFAAVPSRAAAEVAQLYGLLNLSVEAVGGRSADGDAPYATRVSSNTSRFGLRGAESLGHGLVAIWQIESAVSADTGGTTLASRETYLGLDADWGTVKFGNMLTPYDDIMPIFGNVPTLQSSILATAAVWSQGSLSKVAGGFDARLPNSLRYESPEWHGFEANVQYALGEESRHSRVVSLGASYNNGPFEGGLAYERNHKVRGPDLNDWALSVAGAWNFGKLRVAGLYERLHYGTPVGSLSRDFYGASATVVAGAGSVYAFYGQATEGKASTLVRVGGLASGAETGARQYEVSYTYPLSRRTLVYGGYVRLDNESRAGYNFSSNPYTTGSLTGLKLNGFIAGAAHYF